MDGFDDKSVKEVGEHPTPAPKKIVKKIKEKVEEKTEETQKEITLNDVVLNHEQRIVEMEAKWFRLGGI